MLKRNAEFILSQISSSDIVLDIGGWAQPFNRADYVLDVLPYETRGFFGHQGPATERFSKETWIRHDFSPSKPLPFHDKEIDYVVCSHTLEDIRDPIYLCSEINRIGKRGYIEVPSRVIESVIGLEGEAYAGYCHHRWLVEIEDNEVSFRFKSHLLHESWKYHLPKVFAQRLTEEEKVSYLFWENSFSYREVIQVSRLGIEKDLVDFVQRFNAYPAWYYLYDTANQPIGTLLRKLMVMYPVLKRLAEKLVGRTISTSSDWEKFWSQVNEISSR